VNCSFCPVVVVLFRRVGRVVEVMVRSRFHDRNEVDIEEDEEEEDDDGRSRLAAVVWGVKETRWYDFFLFVACVPCVVSATVVVGLDED